MNNKTINKYIRLLIIITLFLVGILCNDLILRGNNKVYADTEYKTYVDGNIEYRYAEEKDGTITLYAFNMLEEQDSLVIPDYINGKKVTGIGEGAFAYCDSLENITIPENVIDIGYSAFFRCDKLKEVNIEGKVNIGKNCFQSCEALEQIIANNGIKSIGDFAFEDCKSLKKIHGTFSTKKIGENAFDGCDSITELDFSEVEIIDSQAFRGMHNLEKITLSSNLKEIKENNIFAGCENLRTIELENNDIYDERNNCKAIIETSTNKIIAGVPDTIIPSTVKVIGSYSFQYCSGREEIYIPGNVRTIEEAAFCGCTDMKKVIIMPGVTTIEDYAFVGCQSLSTVIIPSSVTSIGKEPFFDCDKSVLVIKGTVGSTAETFAKNNGIKFEQLKSTYKVSFESNGGSDVTTQTVVANSRVTEPVAPYREGYTFTGWYTDENCSQKYNFKSYVTDEFTLYAGWRINKYTISFEENGGSEVNNQTITYGKTVSQVYPERVGYTFAGWYTDPELKYAYNFDTVVKNDFTLYAKWNRNKYSIQFNTNGGTSVASQKVYYQSKVTEPESPTKEGYTFTGWFTENECINKYDFNTLVTKSVTLYAGWKINEYTVTFVEAGGSDVENQTVKYGDKVISPNSTRTGYDFSGWYSDSSIKNLFDFDMPITSDIKLYAGWKIKQYVVSFNTNGGSKIPAQTVNYGEKVTEPNSPFIEGANFVGWYLDQDYKTKFDFNNKIKGNHTLYAKWDAVMCKVSFETNGGNNVESQNIIYGKKAIKPDNPIRDGYMFLGWYTDKELTKSYNFNSVVKNGMTLYASWKEIIANVDVSYKTHVQTFGWQDFVMNGSLSGTTGKAKRLEGIKIMVQGNDNLGIQYTTHCQTYGWLPWSANGELNGTEGEAKRLEAIKIQLTGTQAEKYDVYYRVHAQSYGWLNWAKNGEASGTAGYAKRLEGIQIVVVEKGSKAPGNNYLGVSSEYDIPYIFRTGNRNPLVAGDDETNVVYRCNVQSIGWQGWKYNGDKGGTSGQALRLEGLEIRLTNKQYQGGIRYRAQVQSKGWQEYVSNGATSGIVGKNKRLEAFEAELTGELAEHYDLYYRTHVQNYGWLDWAKNGETSGTVGLSKRIEALEMKLVKKTEGAPGKTTRTCVIR